MRLLLPALLLLSLAPSARAADSIRCGGSIVLVGAPKVDLLGKCGEPTRREAHDEQRSNGEQIATVTVERWTYDFGPGEFVRTVSIENGKIVSIAEGDYGTSTGVSRASEIHVSRCDPLHDFSLGDTADQVFARCGEPASREHEQIGFDAATDAPGGASATIEIEVWSYNFGATNFTRVLHFRDGKLVKIVTGGYGFGG